MCAEADWAKLEFVCRTGWRLYKNLFILVGENALAVKGTWNRGYSLALVILIIQVGPNWRAPSKRGVCTYFIAIFHAYSFCVKKCPCYFFKKAEKYGPNYTKIHPPPPLPLCPYPNIVGFRSLRTLCMCVFYDIGGGEGQKGGGGGGEVRWTFKSEFQASFPRLWKKKPGHFLTQKESACQISADSEQLEKSNQNRYKRLSLTEPFI